MLQSRWYVYLPSECSRVFPPIRVAVPGAPRRRLIKSFANPSGTPIPDPARSGPSTAVIVDGEPYVFDAGAGVVRRASSMTPQFGGSIPALEARRIRKVFLTHLHTDHTAGVPDLMAASWAQGAEAPLELYGPPRTIEMANGLLAAYRSDREVRLEGLEPATADGWRVDAHDCDGPGLMYQDDLISVEALHVEHGSWPVAFGFQVTTADRVIVISGDNARPDLLTEAASGADILIHEVYGVEGFGSWLAEGSMDQLAHWRSYMEAFHSRTDELAAMAQKAQPGLVVLHHEVRWTDVPNVNADEISSAYSGAVVSASDFDIF